MLQHDAAVMLVPTNTPCPAQGERTRREDRALRANVECAGWKPRPRVVLPHGVAVMYVTQRNGAGRRVMFAATK